VPLAEARDKLNVNSREVVAAIIEFIEDTSQTVLADTSVEKIEAAFNAFKIYSRRKR
jgi:hypothetical protein